MNYRPGTGGRRCIGAGRRFVFTHQVGALCCVENVMAAILKLWRKVENPTPSVESMLKPHLHEQNSRQISSRSDLKRQSVWFFKRSPWQEEEQ